MNAKRRHGAAKRACGRPDPIPDHLFYAVGDGGVDRALQGERRSPLRCDGIARSGPRTVSPFAEFLRYWRRIPVAPLQKVQGRGSGSVLVNRPLAGAKGADICGDREHIDLVLLVQRVDHRRPRSARHGTSGVPAVHQVGDKLLREVVLVQRRGEPALGAAAAIGGRCPRTHEIAGLWQAAQRPRASSISAIAFATSLRPATASDRSWSSL